MPWLNSKFMTSQTGQQIIAIQILSIISRSKGNQTLKFGQLIEYNMRNIIFKESYSKCGGEARIRPFYEKSKFGSTVSNAIKFVFIICPS